MRRTPEAIKKGLECCLENTVGCYASNCPYRYGACYPDGKREVRNDSLAYIQLLESTCSQVSKALCGKENATPDELLQAVEQLKADLQRERDQNQYTVDAANVTKDEALRLETLPAQVERDAMAAFIKSIVPVGFSFIPIACRCCKNYDGNFTKEKCAFCQTYGINENWQWRGVYEENTKEDANA